MLEEKNDNLQDADGNVANESQNVATPENQEIVNDPATEENNEVVAESTTEEITVEETVTEVATAASDEEAVVDEAPEVTTPVEETEEESKTVGVYPANYTLITSIETKEEYDKRKSSI